MRTLICYTSSTGNTKNYAEEIASSVKADVLPLKKVKAKILAGYDTIVFGGWVLGGQIQGINEFLSNWDSMEGKNVIVFANGMSFVSKENRTNLISDNLLDMYHIRFYQLRGSFDYSKVKFPHNIMLKMSLSKQANNPNASASDRSMLDLLKSPVSYHDDEGVSRIISVINRLASEPAEAEVVSK